MNELESSGEVGARDSETVAESEMSPVANGTGKRRRLLRRKTHGNEAEFKAMDECQRFSRLNANSFEIFSEGKSSGAGEIDGVAGEEGVRRQRARCRQHELNLFESGIDERDVTVSHDAASDEVGGRDEGCGRNGNGPRRDCPGNRLSRSTCSEGSYSRRKHHRHRQKSRDTVEASDGPGISPKVNPIFLWVRQEDTRIMEVFCEDYDHRNRLKLRKTRLGWRAIPKTKCFAEATYEATKTITREEEGEDVRTETKEEHHKERLNKPKKLKNPKKKKKKKKAKRERNGKKEKKITVDNPNLIKECSVALYRDDSIAYRMCQQMRKNEEDNKSTNGDDSDGTVSDRSINCSISVMERVDSPALPPRKLTKSSSCEFSSASNSTRKAPRSTSLDLNRNQRIAYWETDCVTAVSEKNGDFEKGSPEQEEHCPKDEDLSGLKELDDTKKHSENIVMDMTKHDSDFNDADCDELGQLLQEIPDLEFVAEEELEEVDEDEWSTPTDLTLPKPPIEEKSPGAKATLLPVNISPLITVSSTVRPPEPLMAPRPEVTITPIPKPAHQQKSQNNFLESLLASGQSVKPEREERLESSKQPKLLDLLEKKNSRHLQDGELECETKSKKLKCEDITLKSLLSKDTIGRPLDLDKCGKSTDECPKSRLHELLTEKNQSDPISQLKEVLSNPLLPVPDPLLVPRARLPALVASPASEIPRLLTINMEKTMEKRAAAPPTDSDVLEVSLSHLQSLLSSNPEKLVTPTEQDLVNYQKSLGTFLGWQRYQTELMEKHLTNPGTYLNNGYANDTADMTAANAFSQMLWLPYLNQFDLNANRNIMTLMNSMFTGDCKLGATKLTAPPQINTSQVPQPSPFLTPTSPMEIESHLKTLAMWQEAIALQQATQGTRSCSSVPMTHGQDPRKTLKTSYQTSKKMFLGPNQKSSAGTTRGDMGPVPVPEPVPEEFLKRQRHLDYKMSEHQKQADANMKYKQEAHSQYRKNSKASGVHPFVEGQRTCRPNDKKRPMPGCISVKPLSNLVDKNSHKNDNKLSWDRLDCELQQGPGFTDRVAMRLQQFNTQIQRTKVKEENSTAESRRDRQNQVVDAPKLKVKNLVDPNMSPPKLLKQITPDHLTNIAIEEPELMQEDGQNQLWHPLFGSNQMKAQPYNSPWRWTTVTVNGE